MRRTIAAVLAALLGAPGCAPRTADWAAAYLEKDPLGPEAGEAFRLLIPGKPLPPQARVDFHTIAEMY
jgi:hypothetical protein